MLSCEGAYVNQAMPRKRVDLRGTPISPGSNRTLHDTIKHKARTVLYSQLLRCPVQERTQRSRRIAHYRISESPRR